MKISATLFLALTLSVSADDWQQYNGPDSSRTTAEKLTGSKLVPVWKTEANTGFSSFTIADGLAYTIVEREEDGLPQETCVALDAKTGKEKWATPLMLWRVDNDGGNSGARDNKGGDGPRSTPAYSDGHVYTMNAEIGLHCLDAKTGKIVWSADITKKYGGRNIKWENAAAPLIEGDNVYVYGGGKGESLLCFDKKSGKLIWKDHDHLMTHATPIAATINDQRQIIFFTQSGLVFCDPASGKKIWVAEFPYKVSTAASPVVFEDIVYCAAGYGVGAAAFKITKNGAEEIWRLEGNKPVTNHWSTPLAKDGYLYGMFSFKEYGDGPLKCVDIKTGKVQWEKGGFGPGNVTLSGDTLIALTDDGHVVLAEANPMAYKEISRTKAVGGKCWSTPVLANGHIYVRSTTEAACLEVK